MGWAIPNPMVHGPNSNRLVFQKANKNWIPNHTLSWEKKTISYLFRGPSQIIASYLYCWIIIRLSNPVIRRIGLSQVRQTCLTHLSVPFYIIPHSIFSCWLRKSQHLYTLMRFLKVDQWDPMRPNNHSNVVNLPVGRRFFNPPIKKKMCQYGDDFESH